MVSGAPGLLHLPGAALRLRPLGAPSAVPLAVVQGGLLQQGPISLGRGPFWCQWRLTSYGLLHPQDNKKMKKSLEEEQRARKDLEKLVRKVLKNMNDPAWDETNL